MGTCSSVHFYCELYNKHYFQDLKVLQICKYKLFRTRKKCYVCHNIGNIIHKKLTTNDKIYYKNIINIIISYISFDENRRFSSTMYNGVSCMK